MGRVGDCSAAAAAAVLAVLSVLCLGNRAVPGAAVEPVHVTAAARGHVPEGVCVGQTPMVDGVGCDTGSPVVYHVHTHLAVYVDGVLRPLPAGIGIVQPVAQATRYGPFDEATTCDYWRHVHAQDGVIHIESPSVRTDTLGQFFAIWRQPLGPDQIASVRRRLTVWVNGRFVGDPARSASARTRTSRSTWGHRSRRGVSTAWSGTGV